MGVSGRINRFHAHLDVCSQCERHPFDLCLTGAKLLKEAATGGPVVLNKRRDKIPPDAVLVDRTTKWGNPMRVQEIRRLFPGITTKEAYQKATDWYREYITTPFGRPKELLSQIGELTGKDLVCWDAPLPCHADVLLELANRG